VIGISSIQMILNPMTTPIIELESINHLVDVEMLIIEIKGYIPFTNPF